MFNKLYKNEKTQLILGLVFGIAFGFLLNKSMVTNYDVILNQLLLNDWTVFKVIATSIVVGTIGLHILYDFKKVQLYPKSVSIISLVVGGIIFGIGFALLGYCPGIIAGAIGAGSLDALLAGLPGIILGSGIFIYCYDFLDKNFLTRTYNWNFSELLKISHWKIIIPVVVFYYV